MGGEEIADALEARIEQHGPTMATRLKVLVAGAAGLPIAIAVNAATERDFSWLVLFPMVALATSVFSLVFAGDRFRLVVARAGGGPLVIESAEPRPLEALLAELSVARARTAAAPVIRHRLVFLDIVRSLAIVLMIFAHFSDQLLDPALRQSGFGAIYRATRGITAPIFFVVSGWSFAVAVLPGFMQAGIAGLNVGRRLRRGAVLLFWGYALTLPWWAEGFPLGAPAQVWLPFWTAGVLESIGATLLLTTLWACACRRPGAFLAGAGALAALALASAPWISEQVAHWPAPLRGFFDSRGVPGGFPLAPWGGYFLLGLALGGGLLRLDVRPVGRVLALLALALAFGGAHLVVPPPYDLTLRRLALTSAVMGVAATAGLFADSVPAVVRLASRYALTFYVSHMVLLWGAPYFTGLAHRLQAQLGWAECAGFTAAELLATGLAVSLYERMRTAWVSWWRLGRAAERRTSS